MTIKIFSLIVLLFIKTEPLSLKDIDICNSKAFIVTFKPNSLELSSSRDTLMLDQIATIYKAEKAQYIIFESATSEDELLVNENISKQRFDNIVAYFENKYRLKKNIFKLEPISSPVKREISFMNILIRS